MSTRQLNELTAHELHDLLKEKKTSCTEIVQAVLKAIEKKDRKINAYISTFPEEAIAQAKKCDGKLARYKADNLSPLFGMPVALKDNICIKGKRTTAGSKMLHNFISPYDATVVEKLKNAGAIIVGKTNMDEFAFGSSCETSYFGPTLNPHNTACVPGGSSGGSAAAVAANETILSLGSDTGGSIRQPASFCGVCGLKPTYGMVSRYGLIAFASSLDQIGPIAKDAFDCGLLMNIISGQDRRDSTSIKGPFTDYTLCLKRDISGMKIGIPEEYFIEGMDPEVEKSARAAIAVLKKEKVEIKEVSLPHTAYAVAAYYVLATAQASSNLGRYDGVKYGYREMGKNLIEMTKKTRTKGFGKEAKRRIMLGTFGLSAGYYDAYYLKAQKVRTLIRQDFEKVFKDVDLLLTPTSPTPAFKIGERLDDPLTMYLSDIFTISVNLAGIAAISIPCGKNKEGLPIGLQIVGREFSEDKILQLAYFYQQISK